MTRQLGESLDHKQGWRQKLVMKLHLFTCEACERYFEHISFLQTAIHAHGERDPDVAEFAATTLSSESKERIKALLRSNFGLAC